ncbi:MAG TPA: hypothetical protein VKU40_03385 [Thermoanaerobaculia bacterium]|nr:hypothetical protein [Thermoanaerobaculia bacterium]
MTGPHLSPELVEMVLQGELPPRTLVTLMRHHLADLCPECRRVFAELEDGAAWRPPQHAHTESCALEGYTLAFERAAGQALSAADRRAAEQSAAERDLATLLALPEQARRDRVARARSRFRSRALASLMLDECRQRLDDEPVECGALAELAHEVLLRVPGALDGDDGDEGLGARALAYRAEAARATGDLPTADRLFRSLRARLASFPLNDPEVHAEVTTLEAGLRRDQQRWGEMESLLARAVLLHRQALSPPAVVDALSARLDQLTAARLRRSGGLDAFGGGDYALS